MHEVTLSTSFRKILMSTQELDTSVRLRSERLSTGRKVNKIQDNPDVYFASQHLKKYADTLNGDIADNLEFGVRTISTAIKGVKNIRSLVGTLEGVVQNAEDGVGVKDAAKQFDEVLEQINKMAEDSHFHGTNLLKQKEDPTSCKDRTDNLRLRVGNSKNALYDVKGQFAGNDYSFAFLYDPTIIYRPNENGTAIHRDRINQAFMSVNMGEYQPPEKLGNLDNVSIQFRINNGGPPLQQFNSIGDANGDGVVGSGEGFEADFVLDNSTGTADATNISFNNATIISNPAFNFFINTSAPLGDAPAGTIITTDATSDLDCNIPITVPNGTEFYIELDFTVDGITYTNQRFGPAIVGQITSGMTVQRENTNDPIPTPQSFDLLDVDCHKVKDNIQDSFPVWAYTDRVSIQGADYENDMYFLNFADAGQEQEQNTFFMGAKRDGVGLFNSWVYQGLENTEGRAGALMHISEAKDRLLQIEKHFETDATILTSRAEFNEKSALIHEIGADKLILLDLEEESAKLTSERTRLMLSQQSLRKVALSYQSTLELLSA